MGMCGGKLRKTFKIISFINAKLKPLADQINRELEVRKQIEELVGVQEYSEEEFPE